MENSGLESINRMPGKRENETGNRRFPGNSIRDARRPLFSFPATEICLYRDVFIMAVDSFGCDCHKGARHDKNTALT